MEGQQIEGVTLNTDFVYHTSDLWESKKTDSLDKAMVGFNGDFNAVKHDETVSMPGRPNRKFSSLDEIMKTIRPILAKHKLYVQQMVSGDKMITMVRHESGQFRCVSAPMLQWQGQGTNSLQNLGGAMTYLKRYYLSAALCLATEEDDDGASAGKMTTGKPADKPKQSAPPPVQLTEQQQTLVDEWTSQVEQCKTPEDFERLSGELQTIKDSSVLTPIRAAMGAQMAKVKVVFTKGVGFHEAEA